MIWLFGNVTNKFDVSKDKVSIIEVWFIDQNSKPLEIEDKINIAFVINRCITSKMRYSILLIFVFNKNMGENIGKNKHKW